MAKITDLEQVRRARKRRKHMKIAIWAAAIAGAIALVVFVAERMGEIDYQTFFSDISAEFSSGDGYPLALPGGMLNVLTSTEKVLVLATDTNVYSYNATGKQTLSAQHGMSRMSLSKSRNRVLLFDRGGTKYMTLSRSAVSNTGNSEFNIYDADISGNGNFGIMTGCDTYMSMVTVYNRNKEQIYRYFSDKPLVSVSLSDDRDAMVVGNLSTENGRFVSCIKRFQFSIDKEIASTTMQDELLLKLDYHTGSSVRAITDKRAILFDGDLKQRQEYVYDGYSLERYMFRSDGGLVMLLRDLTGADRSRVVILKPDFTVEGSFNAPEAIVDMHANRQYVFFALDSGIAVYDAKGERLAGLDVENLHYLHTMDDILYYATGNELCAVSLHDLLHPDQPAGSSEKPRRSDGEGGMDSRPSRQGRDSGSSGVDSGVTDSAVTDSGNDAGAAASLDSSGTESGADSDSTVSGAASTGIAGAAGSGMSGGADSAAADSCETELDSGSGARRISVGAGRPLGSAPADI